MVTTYQWGIFLANLDPTMGSEQAGTRPVLVISVEEVNQALPIVTIMSITSAKPNRNIYPTEVFLDAKNTGLLKDSIAMAHQIRAISKQRLIKKMGILDIETQEKIKSVIKTYLDI